MGKEIRDLDRDWVFAWWWPTVGVVGFLVASAMFRWTFPEHVFFAATTVGCLVFGKIYGIEMVSRSENHLLHSDYQVRGCVRCLEENRKTE